MDASLREQDAHEFDEGSWIYLRLQQPEPDDHRDLHRRLIEVCEENGWSAVTWSPPRHEKNPADSARFFEGMSHAVAHADVVVALVSASAGMTGAELAFACRHRRPVIALQIEGENDCSSEVRAMLQGYHRAFTVDCTTFDECISGLKRAFQDPSFGAIIHEASGEPVHHA